MLIIIMLSVMLMLIISIILMIIVIIPLVCHVVLSSNQLLYWMSPDQNKCFISLVLTFELFALTLSCGINKRPIVLSILLFTSPSGTLTIVLSPELCFISFLSLFLGSIFMYFYFILETFSFQWGRAGQGWRNFYSHLFLWFALPFVWNCVWCMDFG